MNSNTFALLKILLTRLAICGLSCQSDLVVQRPIDLIYAMSGLMSTRRIAGSYRQHLKRGSDALGSDDDSTSEQIASLPTSISLTSQFQTGSVSSYDVSSSLAWLNQCGQLLF